MQKEVAVTERRGAGPGSPAQPTHAASRSPITPSIADTKPPGLRAGALASSVDDEVDGEAVYGNHQVESRSSNGHG